MVGRERSGCLRSSRPGFAASFGLACPARGSPPPIHLPFDFHFPASIFTPTASEYEAGFQPMPSRISR